MSRGIQSLQLVPWLQSGYFLNDSVWLVSVLFGLSRYPTPEPMAGNALDVEHGEKFTSQQGREDTGTKSVHGDVSEDLPMEVDTNLSMQMEQKNGNEMIVYT
jgi:hypothetical protein